MPTKTFTLFAFMLLLGVIRVAALPEVTVISLPDDAMVPDAEIDRNGRIHVAYLSDDNVYYVRSDDGGETFSRALRVNSVPDFASGGAFRGPDLAVGENGRIHVIWYNAGYQQKRPHEEWGVMYARLAPNADAFEPSRNLNRRPSDNFSLAADGNGNVAVVWMAEEVFVTRSENDGESFAPAEELELDPCECCGSRAAFAANGDLLILFRDKTDNVRDAQLLRMPAEGKPEQIRLSQTPWPIEGCPMTGGFLTVAGSSATAAWETKGSVYFARVPELTKETVIEEIRVSEKGRYPVALVAPGGVTLVAWKNGSRLEWKLFDEAGRPTKMSGRKDTSSSHRPSGVVTTAGDFLLFP